MSLATLSVLLAGLGGLFTGRFGVLFLLDPERGFAATTHRPEELPKVMADRYFAFALLALGSAVYGDFRVIAYLFAVFALVSFADAWIYARIDRPYVKHFAAGVMSIIVMVVALLALNSGVPA